MACGIVDVRAPFFRACTRTRARYGSLEIYTHRRDTATYSCILFRVVLWLLQLKRFDRSVLLIRFFMKLLLSILFPKKKKRVDPCISVLSVMARWKTGNLEVLALVMAHLHLAFKIDTRKFLTGTEHIQQGPGRATTRYKQGVCPVQYQNTCKETEWEMVDHPKEDPSDDQQDQRAAVLCPPAIGRGLRPELGAVASASPGRAVGWRSDRGGSRR